MELQAEMTGGGKGAKFTLKGLAPVLVLMYLEKGERSNLERRFYCETLLFPASPCHILTTCLQSRAKNVKNMK